MPKHRLKRLGASPGGHDASRGTVVQDVHADYRQAETAQCRMPHARQEVSISERPSARAGEDEIGGAHGWYPRKHRTRDRHPSARVPNSCYQRSTDR
jgi:hypothetical protein